MVNIIKTEFYKMKRYSVIWIGVATMLTVVLLSRFMATASDGASHTLINFSSSVIWNNLVLIYPATITLIAGYIIDRERTDDTLKNILTIPVSFRKMLIGKLIAVGCMAIALSVIEFVFTIMVFFASSFPGFSVGVAVNVLLQMIGINLISYIAVMPIITFTAQRSGSFMPGVGFALFYGFVGMMASGHGLRDLYPITAGLTLLLCQLCYEQMEFVSCLGINISQIAEQSSAENEIRIEHRSMLFQVLLVLSAPHANRRCPRFIQH